MKGILALLLAIPYVYGQTERNCVAGSSSIAFQDGDPQSFDARARLVTCPHDDWACAGTIKGGFSVLLDGSTPDTQTTKSWTTMDLGCAPPDICDRFAGGVNSCQYATYSWNRYDPQSCNETAMYDAEWWRQTVKIYFACCNTLDYCNKPRDSTRAQLEAACTENTALGGYIDDLHKCWNEARLDWRRYFVCNENGQNLVQFNEICINETYGDWSRYNAMQHNETCFFRPTCSDDLRTLLTSFGECACDAANNHSFTGEMIGAIMESQWNDFCPGIEVRCAGDMDGERTLWLRQRLRRRIIRFRIERAVDAVTDAVREAIRDKIAAHQQCTTDTLQVGMDTTNARRLLATTTDLYAYLDGTDAFNQQIGDAICSDAGLTAIIGETATVLGCYDTDVYEDVYGSNGTMLTTMSAETTAAQTTPMGEGNTGSFVTFVVAMVMGVIGIAMQ